MTNDSHNHGCGIYDIDRFEARCTCDVGPLVVGYEILVNGVYVLDRNPVEPDTFPMRELVRRDEVMQWAEQLYARIGELEEQLRARG